MNEHENIDIDLGSDPIGEDFDPFASDDEELDTGEVTGEEPVSADTPPNANTPAKTTAEKTDNTEQALEDKPPVFEYAGASANIEDASKTFDELRIEKAADFPELEDGKRVSWTVEYGKITKTVADPKGMSIGKMKSDIETSKEFEDSLKKRGADKNPTCKIKPRVTAQSKGTAVAYKGVFTNMEDALASGKLITLIPARDGKVYEMRQNEMGKFITHSIGNSILSEVRAGFTPALPLIPFNQLLEIISFFKMMAQDGNNEALANIYWDKEAKTYITDIPQQTVSVFSVKGEINPEYDNDRYIHYMDIHSHNTMKAFFSATDDKDEKATRVYTVIGNVLGYFPEIKVRISNGGIYHEIDPRIVFEEYNFMKKMAVIWFNQFKCGINIIADMLSGIGRQPTGGDGE